MVISQSYHLLTTSYYWTKRKKLDFLSLLSPAKIINGRAT